ncbi:histidine triad (HIT) family protein, partial [Pancytospora epiphaga]
MGCLFCQLQSNKENIIYEDESLYVILDRFPLSNRHLLVIPKNHYEFFHLCPEDIVSAMALKARELVITLKMEKYNLLQNNGNCQLIRHSHLHIIEA